jgi:uncharacterized protein YjiS (DUF1127 family)
MTIHSQAVAPRAGGFFARWRTARRNRRRDLALSALSDRLLRDIGLERDDRYPPCPMLGPWI